jgi:hypothetical protein
MIIHKKPKRKRIQPNLDLPFEIKNGVKYIKLDIDSENKVYWNEQINKPRKIKLFKKK